MFTLHIEHAVRDFARWKAAFDSDPAGRARSGVRRYRVSRDTGEPLRVTIDLDFDDLAHAEGMLATMRQIWRGAVAQGAVDGEIRTAIVQQVEIRELADAA